uniref:Uncharacterized protein n=1 Tax=Daucus carota subsp. sativus TaxID=79200 RepID=A0A165A6W0_DAUCS
MVMDPGSTDFSDVLNGFEFGDEVVLPGFDSPPNYANTFKFKDELVDLSFLDIPDVQPEPDYAGPATNTSTSTVNNTSPTGSSEMYSPEDNDDGVLKFLNQILMEEKIEEKPSMFYDPLALQAAEQSLYEALGKQYPPSYGSGDVYQHADSPYDYFTGSSSEYSTSSGGTTAGNYYEPPHWVADSVSLKSSTVQHQPSDYNIDSRSQWSVTSENSLNNNLSGVLDSPMSTQVIPNIFSDRDSILQFKRGMEEASKFLPKIPQLVVNLDNYALRSDTKEGPPVLQVKVEKDEEIAFSSLRGRKHLLQQDSVVEDERSSKQLAVYEEEVEITELFDKVLLSGPCCDKEEPIEFSPAFHHENGLAHGSNGGKSRFKKTDSTSEAVDLRTLLISCAQSVASEDRRTAHEQLKLIRQYSSASGDASQRLANIFANGLEARMAGTGTQLYAALSSRRISATEKLKAYQAYLKACPFKKTSVFFANKMILEKSSTATTLHIIDFVLCTDNSIVAKLEITARLHSCKNDLKAQRLEVVNFD